MARRRPQVCKVDDQHAAIVNNLRALGLSVSSLAKVAAGMPDICVGYAGVNLLFEIKSLRNKRGDPEALTPAEVEWHRSWLGQVAVVTDSKQVIDVMEKELKKCGIPHISIAMFAHTFL